MPSQIPSALLEVRSLCGFLLHCWKSGKSGPSVLLEIRSLCIWKRLGGFQESIKMLIPLTGLLIDLSSSQTRTSLLEIKLWKRHEIWKKIFYEFSMAKRTWFSMENSSLYCASDLVFTTKLPFFLVFIFIFCFFVFFFCFCFLFLSFYFIFYIRSAKK